MALMRMAGDLRQQSDTCPRGGSETIGFDSPGRKETFCSFSCHDSFVDANHLSQTDNEDRQFESQYFERGGQQVGSRRQI
jgi:hypothetical protein